jgi:hypothetical protein
MLDLARKPRQSAHDDFMYSFAIGGKREWRRDRSLVWNWRENKTEGVPQ